MKVITIGNEKGGCGKTTIATNLAVEATIEGLKVLVIDSDSQASAMDFRGIRADKELPQFQAVAIVKNTIHKDVAAFQDFDLILIDAGGRDTAVFRSAILAADLLVIPVLPSQYDIWSTAGTLEALGEARTFRDIEARLVLNQIIPNTKVSREALEALKEFDVPLLSSKLCSRVDFKHCTTYGMGVSEYNNGKAADEMKALWAEIKNVIGGN